MISTSTTGKPSSGRFVIGSTPAWAIFLFFRHQRFDARSERATGRSQFGQIRPWLVDARVDRRDDQLATAAAGTIRRQSLSAGGHDRSRTKWRTRQKEMERIWILKSQYRRGAAAGENLLRKVGWKRKAMPIVEGYGVTDVRKYPAQIMDAAGLRRGLSAVSRPGRYHRCLRRQDSAPALRHGA